MDGSVGTKSLSFIYRGQMYNVLNLVVGALREVHCKYFVAHTTIFTSLSKPNKTSVFNDRS